MHPSTPQSTQHRSTIATAFALGFALASAGAPWHDASAASCTHPAGHIAIPHLGDTNGDGKVNVVDALCSIVATLAIQAGSPLSSVGCIAPEWTLADPNCDGSVNISDVLTVVSIGVGFGTPTELLPDAGGCPAACASCASGGQASCLIAGSCVAEGYRIGADGCQVCDPSADPLAYTTELGTTYYLDSDGDDAGVTGQTQVACVPLGDYTALQGGDCDDGNPAAYPGAAEICGNGEDENCINGPDENCTGTGSGGGNDGPLVLNGPQNQVDVVSTAAGTACTVTVTTPAAASFAPGDNVLLHQTLGTGAGQWELGRVASTSASTVTLEAPLRFTYTTGSGSAAQILALPEYTDVTIQSGGELSAPAWNGTTGGILAFMASGTVTVAASGRISMDGKGYRGGSGGSAGAGGGGGESYNGFGSTGGAAQSCSRPSGAGSGDNSCSAVAGAVAAGGGGADGTANDDDGAGAGGGGGYGGGGGGGAAGGGCGGNGSGDGGLGGGTDQNAGGGGGSTCPGGHGGNPNSAGAGANPGAAGNGTTGGGGGGGGGSSGTNYGGGGGGGGGRYGDALMARIFPGGGGAGGGGSSFGPTGGAGGAGGGIVIVFAGAVTVEGEISSDGATGVNPGGVQRAGAGGGGAGGAILVRADSVSGSGALSAQGGARNALGPAVAGGGAGGVGRIRLEHASGAAPSSAPTASTGPVSLPATPGDFRYTGGDQTFVVPPGVTSIQVKLWGAGGSGGGDAFSGAPSVGGAGGFAAGTLAVAPGESLTVIVGGGGAFAPLTPSYGGGGPGGATYGGSLVGSGGGRSALRRGSTELITAGGGGGGGGEHGPNNGGAGGGLSGSAGSGFCPGAGGTQSSGGAGGTCNHSGSVTPAAKFQGGADSYCGGGGGGGWYGGGPGNHQSPGLYCGAGGGGSSHLSAEVSGGLLTGGTGATPGGVNDSDYDSNTATGGANRSCGAPGRVLITY